MCADSNFRVYERERERTLERTRAHTCAHTWWNTQTNTFALAPALSSETVATAAAAFIVPGMTEDEMLQAAIDASKASLEEEHSGVQAGSTHTSVALDIKISEYAMESIRILVCENSASLPKLDVLKEWSKFSVLEVPQSPAQLTKERMVADPTLSEKRMNKRLEAEEDLHEEARGAIF